MGDPLVNLTVPRESTVVETRSPSATIRHFVEDVLRQGSDARVGMSREIPHKPDEGLAHRRIDRLAPPDEAQAEELLVGLVAAAQDLRSIVKLAPRAPSGDHSCRLQCLSLVAIPRGDQDGEFYAGHVFEPERTAGRGRRGGPLEGCRTGTIHACRLLLDGIRLGHLLDS